MGDTNFDWENTQSVIDFILTADKFNMENVVDFGFAECLNRLTRDNVLELWLLSNQVKSAQYGHSLKRRCKIFISDYIKKLDRKQRKTDDLISKLKTQEYAPLMLKLLFMAK